MKLRWALLAGVMAMATQTLAAPPILIRGAAVFDGERALGTRSVLIADGRIADPDFRGSPPKDATIVEAAGKTLLPGLIDAHVHAFADVETPLLYGVTTQLDMFTPPQANAEVKAKSRNGGNDKAADLFSAGYLATAPKGHGTQFGAALPTLTTPAEADAWVAARIAEGSDYIKIINEPGGPRSGPLPTLDQPTIDALIAAAHKRGKLAVVHVQTHDAAKAAFAGGADGLVHLFTDKPASAELVALAKAKGVFVTPTYTVIEGFRGRVGSAALIDAPGLAGLLPKSAVANVRQTLGEDRTASLDATMSASIAAFARAGVPILAGTDAGNPGTWYGLSMHRELELLVNGGLTPAQALTAATAAPAKAYRLADRGRIAKGMKADLLLVDGDPTRDIKATRNIVEVWINGVSANPLRAARRTEVAGQGSARPVLALPPDGRVLTVSGSADPPALSAPFGSWAPTTDAMIGGKSRLTVARGGTAPSGQPGVLLTGEVLPGGFARWAGLGLMPGSTPFGVANLSAATAVRFLVRGEGPGFGLMAFSETSGRAPIVKPFTAGKDWQEVVIAFADLKGFNPADAQMLSFNALEPGAFRLEIADVRLIKQ